MVLSFETVAKNETSALKKLSLKINLKRDIEEVVNH
jgi:hypothetical protein